MANFFIAHCYYEKETHCIAYSNVIILSKIQSKC